MKNVESVTAESAVEVIDVESVPAGGIRLLAWPTGELQYCCRVHGGWVLSRQLDGRRFVDRRAGKDGRAEILPILETMAEGGNNGPFDGDFVARLVGCRDLTEIAADIYDGLKAVRMAGSANGPAVACTEATR